MLQSERVVPVVVNVLEDGQLRTVRVGQAVVSENQVVLTLEPLRVQLELPVAEAGGPPLPASAHVESRLVDLEWLAQRSRKLLADPKKARWHDDTRVQLAQIEAEVERLRA